MIALGLLTAPRSERTLEATLASLRANGFGEEIHLFAEPGVEPPAGDDLGPLRWHPAPGPEPEGNWANWRRAATWLVENTDAPFLMVCDDDFRVCHAARPRLEDAFRTLPHHDFGFLSLFTPIRNLIQHHKEAVYGWQDVPVGFGGWGTVALAFTRENLIRILTHHETALFPLDRDADIFLCKLCTSLSLRTWYHLPSLAEHTGGGNSTLEHGDFRGFEAVGFREDFGAAPDDLEEVQHHDPPLVSCIMPTEDRPEFARQAMEAFRRQSYPNRELIVIECGDSGIRAEVEADPRMTWFQVPPYMTLGARRNLACRMAKGSLISFWDDDDWHAPSRLEAQAAPLLAGQAELTALANPFHYDTRTAYCYRPKSKETAASFYHFGIHTGTLLFKREFMREEFIFPDMGRGEDYIFARSMLEAGARLERIQRDDLYLYLRHGTNTWPFEVKGEPDPENWECQKGLPNFLPGEVAAFYEGLASTFSDEETSPA